MRKSQVEQSCRVSWITSLMRQLSDEVRVASPGVADRIRVAEIYGRSVSDVEQKLALDILNELKAIPLPSDDQGAPGAGPGVIEGGPVSRVGRLLDNIETAQFGEQRQQARRTGARVATAREGWHSGRVSPSR